MLLLDACWAFFFFFFCEWRGLGLGVAEGQTSIIRLCGATGLSPLVGRRLGWFHRGASMTGGYRERQGLWSVCVGGLNGNSG